MKKLLFVAAASVVFATPAFAEDAAAPAGARVEALVGYDNVSAEGEDVDGVLFGLGAGYDFAVGSGVALGLDIEAAESTTDIGDVSAARDLYAGARATFAVGGSTNLYLKAGYTNARFKVEGLGGENFDGVRVGAGLQTGIGGKAYVGGEVRYSNYEYDLSRLQAAVIVGTRF